MAKYLSKNAVFFLGGYDLGQDTLEAFLVSRVAALDPTAITDAAERALAGVSGGEFSHRGILDDAAGQINAAAAALQGAFPVVTLAINTQGKRALSAVVLQAAFKTPTDLRGLILQNVMGQVDGKVGVGILLQPKVVKTANFNGTGVNNGASSANGADGFLHVFAANGTATLKIEHSSDNGSTDPYAAVITFAQVSGVTSEKVEATGTIKQWLRATLTLGTATSVTYAVTVARG